MLRVELYYNYTTQEGDTFDMLALYMYNNEMYASYIMQFNPDYCHVLVFDSGIKLKLPVFDATEIASNNAPWRTAHE